MAEVILDFAKPLIADLHDDSDEAFNTVITMAVTVWNIAQSPEEMQDTFITELSERIAAENPAAVGEIQEVVALLLKRKQELYSDNNRIVVDYKVLKRGDHRHLDVVSAESPG